jgi:16S rRNA (cytidine1402-2'-O)-methyltransferase
MNGGVTPSRVRTSAPGGGGGTEGTPPGGIGVVGAVAHAAMKAAKLRAAPARKVLGVSVGRVDDLPEAMKNPSSNSGENERGDRSQPRASSPSLDAALYIVSTPIGNLRDITLRALDILASVNKIYAEDTRVARRLLDAHGLKARAFAYHDHSAETVREDIVSALGRGESVALISDAGTPLVSDPGYKLVRAAIDAGHSIVPIPGPSAALAALVASGLPSDRFLFAGFLPNKDAARRTALAEFAAVPATLIVYETGPRLAESLAAMAGILGPRDAVVARELTKLFEEVRRAPLNELAALYEAEGPPKGEIVVVVAPPLPPEDVSDEALAAFVAKLSTLSAKDAAERAAADLGVPRKRAYAAVLSVRETT